MRNRSYAQRGEAKVLCENEKCEYYFIVEAWIERDDVYLQREECPKCSAPFDLDIVAGNVSPL